MENLGEARPDEPREHDANAEQRWARSRDLCQEKKKINLDEEKEISRQRTSDCTNKAAMIINTPTSTQEQTHVPWTIRPVPSRAKRQCSTVYSANPGHWVTVNSGCVSGKGRVCRMHHLLQGRREKLNLT